MFHFIAMNTSGLFSAKKKKIIPCYSKFITAITLKITEFVYLTKNYKIALWRRRRYDSGLCTSPCPLLRLAWRRGVRVGFPPRMNQPLRPWVPGKFPAQHPAT